MIDKVQVSSMENRPYISGPFCKQILSEYNLVHLLCFVYGCFLNKIVDVSSFERNSISSKAENIYYVALYIKGSEIFDLFLHLPTCEGTTHLGIRYLLTGKDLGR